MLYGKETEALANGNRSLTERIAALGGRGDARDLHWGVNFARVGDVIELSPYPKTPNAWRDSPISLNFGTRFKPEHADLRRQFERLMRYGAEGNIVLNSEHLTHLSISGPTFFATKGTDGELEVSRKTLPHAVGKSAELRLLNGDGATLSAHVGDVTYANHGTDGWAIKVRFYEHAIVEIDLPHLAGRDGAIHISYNFRSVHPHQVLLLADLLGCLAIATRCEFYLDGQRAGVLGLPAGQPQIPDEVNQIAELATDLDIVQRHCSQYFIMPKELTAWDRVNLRVARLIIEGFLVASPRVQSPSITLTGEESPELELLLDGNAQIRCRTENFTLTLGDRELPIGTVGVYHPSARVVDAEDARAALKNGTARDRELQLKPGDEPYFYIYLIVDDARDRPQDLKVALWSLADIDQPGLGSAGTHPADHSD